MSATGPYAAAVVARLTDFFSPKTHWQRRLWNVGLLMGLREIMEATEAVRARALSQEALGWLADRMRRRITADPGAGDQPQRTALLECLKRDLTVDGLQFLMLRELTEDIDAEYFPRWADELRSGQQLPGEERVARAVAAHLLDSGFGLAHLTTWLDDIVAGAGDTLDIADLLDAGSALRSTPLTIYEMLVLFDVEPSRNATRPSEWISSADASAWLRSNGFATVKVRQRGGLRLRVDARDEEGAVNTVADTIDRFVARVVVGASVDFALRPEVYVAGGRVMDRSRLRRSVKVHALARADRVYDLANVGPLDSALELLSHLDTGPPAVAVAAGWSAIESLLKGPGDKANVAAADRLGALVSCSWPRAELTDLAWAKIAQDDEALCGELLGLHSYREKATRMIEELGSGPPIRWDNPSDAAAAKRVSKAIVNRKTALYDVRAYAIEAFRRLYRVRNIILHAGRTDPVALDPTLRTAPPLVAAGMDRVAHAYLVSGRMPLELAARAELEVERAGSLGAPELTDLLERG